ncbi:MAG: hypothetical protein JRI27_10985 [Deltaproteobacteria bacterium]|nr:hypothetical protein [Deltaproteobacteria bacterium]
MTIEEMLKKVQAYKALREVATPGSWVVKNKGNKCWIFAKSGGVLAQIVYDKHQDTFLNPYSRAADASLMAAAPEMAKLLDRLANIIKKLADKELQDAVAMRFSGDSVEFASSAIEMFVEDVLEDRE